MSLNPEVCHEYQTQDGKFMRWLYDIWMRRTLVSSVQLSGTMTPYGPRIDKEHLLPCVALAVYHGEVDPEKFTNLVNAIEGRIRSRINTSMWDDGWDSHNEYVFLLNVLKHFLEPIVDHQRLLGQHVQCSCRQKGSRSGSSGTSAKERKLQREVASLKAKLHEVEQERLSRRQFEDIAGALEEEYDEHLHDLKNLLNSVKDTAKEGRKLDFSRLDVEMSTLTKWGERLRSKLRMVAGM